MDAALRTYTVKRGETLHGISKRLTGATAPHEIAGYTQAMSRANGHLPAGLLKEGTVLVVPLEFPWSPSVGWAPGSRQDMALRYQQREEIANDTERLYDKLREMTDDRDWWRKTAIIGAVLLVVVTVAFNIAVLR